MTRTEKKLRAARRSLKLEVKREARKAQGVKHRPVSTPLKSTHFPRERTKGDALARLSMC